MSDVGEPFDDIVGLIIDTPAAKAEETDIVADAQLRTVREDEVEAVTALDEEGDEEAAEDDADADPDEPVDAEEEAVTYDEEDSDEADEEPVERLHTVKVDGKPQLVTYDELLRGYSGQAYIQQSFEAIKSEKQQLAEAAEFLRNERERLLQISQQVSTGRQFVEPTPPPREMLQTDPLGYWEAKEKYEDDVKAYQKSVQDYQSLQQEAEAEKQRKHQAYLQEQARLLAEAIPEFADPKKGAALRDKMIAAGGLYGFSEQEMLAQPDARYIRVLNDAIKFRELQNGRKEAEKKANPVQTSTVKPGVKKSAVTSKTQAAKTAAARMRKFGTVDDVASFLLS